MPARAGILIKEMRVSSGRGTAWAGPPESSCFGAISRTRTEDARHGMSVSWRRTRDCSWCPKSRRGGMLATDRPRRLHARFRHRRCGHFAARLRKRWFSSAGVQVRPAEPRHSTKAIRAGFRKAAGQPIARPAAIRSHSEQWSTLRTGSISRNRDLPSTRLERPAAGFRGVWGSNTAAGAIPPGPGTARMAQVRIELQESVRYAISTEEDRP